jgi:hypothetical protein
MYYVLVGDYKSDTKTVKCGIPQGSILGPVLFLLFINDFIEFLNAEHTTVHADDCTVFCSSKDVNDLQLKLNNILINV